MPNPDDRAPRRRRLLWLGVGLLVLLAGFGAWRLLRRPAPLLFTTATVDKGPVVARVTATGILSALVTVQVGSQVSGRIAKLLTDFNATVKKDQLIAVIDPALFQANVEQAKANVLSAQGALQQAEAKAVDAKRQYERDKPLRAQNLIAQADLDTAQANYDAAAAAVVSAKGNLAQAKAQLTQAQVNLEYTTIESPIDGTVISRSVDVGQTVAASLAAPTLFTSPAISSRCRSTPASPRPTWASWPTGWRRPSWSTPSPTSASRGTFARSATLPRPSRTW
jgi:HlyD family secretion protein